MPELYITPTHEKLRQVTTKEEFDRCAPYLKECLYMERIPYNPQAGFSKFVGLPDLPSGVSWPRGETRPLSFLLQIDLSEVPNIQGREMLPARGYLYFFYDTIDTYPEDYKVIFYQGERPQGTVKDFPPELEEDSHVESSSIRFVTTLSPMDYDSILTDLKAAGHKNADDLAEELVEELEIVLEKLELKVLKLHEHPHHQLLGYARPVQGPLEEELAFNAKQNKNEDQRGLDAQRWKFIAQVDSDENWMWGDAGTLYFLLIDEDLAAARFDKTRCVMQCY